MSTRSITERRRLLDVLDRLDAELCEQRTVAVTAPAGSGKTVLVSDWVRRRTTDSTPVAWLTIIDADNDVHMLRTAITTAIARCGDPAVTAAASRVPAVGSPDYADVDSRMSELLDAAPAGLCLIVDDAHLLRDAEALRYCAELLRWAPDDFRTVVIGRFDPPLLLTRLRMTGTVIDITAEQLAFTSEEAKTLMARHHLDLGDSVLDSVMATTEGWAGGLQLAALTASRSDSPDAVLTGYGLSDRTLSDYLVDEFISSLDPETKRILVATSVPDVVSATLANQLAGSPKAVMVLEALVRSNFLISREITPEGAVYRYHPLMRAFLRAEASSLDPSAIDVLERRAADWYLEHGRPMEALSHALRAADPDAVTDVVEHAAPRLLIGELPAADVLEMLARATDRVAADPTTRLVTAMLHLAAGDAAPAAATSASFERSTAAPSTETVAVLRAILRAQLSLLDARSEPSEAAAALAGLAELGEYASDRPDLNAAATYHRGLLGLVLGRFDDADRHLTDAYAHARAARSSTLEMHCLGAQTVLTAFRGHFGALTEISDRATGTAVDNDLTNIEPVHVSRMYSAYGVHLRMEDPVSDMSSTWTALASSSVPAVVEAARVVRCLTDPQANPEEKAAAVRPHRPSDLDPLAPPMTAMLAGDLQHALMAAQHGSDATTYLAHVRARMGTTAECALLEAMVQRFHGRHMSARAMLSPILDSSVPTTHPLTMIWSQLEVAVLAMSQDEESSAFAHLTGALELCEKDRIRLPFTKYRGPVRELIDRNRGRFGRLERFAEDVRHVVKHDREADVVRLSPREFALLQELPSFHTAEAIAADHYISVNTVKTHLRAIYRKLGVGNRREAIAAAQRLGLL